jgi:LAGLIDADG DNA endonuclease family
LCTFLATLWAKIEYFNLVFSYFSGFCTANYTPVTRTNLDSRNGEAYLVISFATMQLVCFNIVHSLFYQDNTKIVPYNIFNLLTPIGLAFWIMDDGSRQNDGLHLSVYSFDSESVDRLLKTLRDKFNLKCSIHKHDRGPRIYIWAVAALAPWS